MKRPTLANENMVSLYAGRSYLSPSSKTPLQSYQKSLGLNYNSPKNEPQKGFVFSQKAMGTNLRASAKLEKSEPALERKNSKTNNDSYSKGSNSTLAYAGITRPNKPRGSSTKATPPKKAEQGQYGLKYADALNMRDALLKQQTRSRNLEVNTDIQTFKIGGAVKAYSTKARDLQERLQVSTLAGGEASYSGLDYSSKYFVNQTTTAVNNQDKLDYARTEGNDEKQSITPATKQKTALSRILANAAEKSYTGTIRRNDDEAYYNSSPQGALKVNNFFTSTKKKELENSMVPKRDKSLNISTKEQNSTYERDDMGRSVDFNSKPTNKSQVEYKLAYKSYAANDESKDDIKDNRNLSLSINKESKSAANIQKGSLSSFITKVDKGSALPIRPKRDEDDSPGLGPNRPYLTLEDKATTKPTRNASESRATSNTENKGISFSKNRINNQALAPSQEVVKTKSKSIGITPANRDVSREQENSEEQAKPKDSFTYYVTSLQKHHRVWDETDYFCQLYKEHFIQSFQALTFCKYLRPVDPKVLAQKKVFLPKRPTHKDKKTVIFDLDETLIHCNESADIPCDVVLPIRFPHGEIIEAGINVRPYALEILKEISQHFEVIVFTASHSCYANVVLDYLDPNGQYVHHRLFRENCVVTDEGIYIKDLRILGNRNLQDMVLVDNAAYSFGYQVENGIPIVPFYDNKEDQELKHLIPYLKSLLNVKDCREVNKQTFKFSAYTMYDSLDKVLNKVVLQN